MRGYIMANAFLVDMGKRIADRRKTMGITQEKLAEQMGVSIQMISNMERGRKAVRPENLASLCKALNTSADYILTGEFFSKETDKICNKINKLSEENTKILDQIIDVFLKNEK